MNDIENTEHQTRITFSYSASATSSKILILLSQLIEKSNHIIYRLDSTDPKFEMVVQGKVEGKNELTPILKKIFGKHWQAVYKYISIQYEVLDNTENIHGSIKTKSSIRTIYTPMKG